MKSLPMDKEHFKLRTSVDENGCWIWQRALKSGSRNHKYGWASFNGTQQNAHRIAWRLFNGDIPDGMFVCHKCDVPQCVNPEHLFLGTAADNSKDMMEKGRYKPPLCMGVFGEKSLHAKLTTQQVLEIRGKLKSGLSQRKIAKEFGIDYSTVYRINVRKIWAHLP